ncbi:MAG: DUF2252 domain-containing protein [Gemmatimonadaceae bacterium]|nr:DUF2252 domain-containing protein [Gemmatimonadaceae bacterium]
MPRPSTIVANTRAYDTWLTQFVSVREADLRTKHARMTESPFALLRATYYHWLTLWQAHSGTLADATVVRSIGDVHIENFGTWRDGEGRLIWGVNDFDESSPLPWTHDLVRLATSAMLATEHGDVAIAPKDACAALWEGYRESLAASGRPFVLAEINKRLRAMATERLKDPLRFWSALGEAPVPDEPVPRSARRMLERALPPDATNHSMRTRVSGLGSLGRPRYLLLATWGGASVAREVKALAPPAACFALGAPLRTWVRGTVRRAIRVADPSFGVDDRWIVRRLAPDCSRIELASLPHERDETKLLYAMGWETANVHLGSASRRSLRREAAAHTDRWLARTARVLHDEIERDYEAWCAAHARDAT